MHRQTSVRGFRDLRMEVLEQRQLLAINAMPIPISPQAFVVTSYVHDQTVYATNKWDTTVTMAQERVISTQPGVMLNTMMYPTKPYMNLAAVDEILLKADLMNGEGDWGKEDGYFETTLASGRVLNNQSVTFALGWGFAIPQQGLSLQVEATIDPNAVPQRLGLAEPTVSMQYGSTRLNVMNFGPPNPTHSIEKYMVLDVRQIAGPSTDVAVANGKGYTALSFEASAEGGDLSLTTVYVAAAEGDLRDGATWELWANTDEKPGVDTILQEGVWVEYNEVAFRNLAGGGFVIPEGQTAQFEARFNAANSFVTDTMRAELNGISVEKVSDGSYADWSLNRDAKQTEWTFKEMGDLGISKRLEVPSHQYLLGTQGPAAEALDFEASYESLEPRYLGVDADAVSIDRIDVRMDGGTALVAQLTRGGAQHGDDFGMTLVNSQIVFPEGGTTRLSFEPVLRSDVDGGVSGETFTVDFDTVEFVGVDSSNVKLFEGVGFVSREHTTVGAKIASVINANPDSPDKDVPTGNYPVGQFKYTTAENSNSKNGVNEAVLDALVFTVDTVNVEMAVDGFALYNKADPSTTVQPSAVCSADGTPVTGDTVTGIVHAVFTGLAESPVQTAIGSGASATLVLQANITNPLVDPAQGWSFLQVGFRDFTDPNGSFGVLGSHVSVLDRDSGGAHRLDWIEYVDSVVFSTEYGTRNHQSSPAPEVGPVITPTLPLVLNDDTDDDEDDAPLAGLRPAAVDMYMMAL